MAELEKISLTIENEATCSDSMDHKGEASHNLLEGTVEGIRISGGDCDCSPPPPNYPRNPLVVRSGELPPASECVPSCPYARNSQAPSCSSNRGGQQQSNRSKSQSQDCGCSSIRARRTSSSHYMEYKEFEHSPKKNPVYEPTDCSKYPPEPPKRCSCSCKTSSRRQSVERISSPPETRKRWQSEGTCASGCSPRGQSEERSSSCQENLKRRQSEGTCASGQTAERRSSYSCQGNRKRRQSESTCASGIPPRGQSAERSSSCQGNRKRRQSESTCASGIPPRGQSAERSSSCQGNRKRRQSKSTCPCGCSPRGQSAERSSSCQGNRAESKSSTRRNSRRTNNPPKSYYLGRTTPAAQAPDVRCHAHSHAHGSCQRPAPPPTPCRKSRTSKGSTSPSKGGKYRPCSVCQQEESNQYSKVPSHSGISIRRPITASNSCHKSCTYERGRSRSPSGTKPQTSGQKPSYCSNETLMEKPVNSYRFSCAEIGRSPAPTKKLCPKCHKLQMQKQRKVSVAKRCASGAAQKYCVKCGLLPMMPRISMPNVASSNRCIYKTLGRPNPIYKAKYELTLCCRRRRCQGGKTCHHLTSTIATNMKKRSKFNTPEGGSKSPTRTSVPRSNHSRTGRSNSNQALPVPAPPEGPDRRRARSTAGRAPGQPVVQKRRHFEHVEPMFERNAALASPRAAPGLAPMSAPRSAPISGPGLVSMIAPALGNGLTPLAPQHTQGMRLPEAEIHSSSRRHHTHRERSRALEEGQEQGEEREHQHHRHHHHHHRHHDQAAPQPRAQPERSNQMTPQPRAQPERSNQVTPHHRPQPETSHQVTPHHRPQPEPSHQVTPHHRAQPEPSNQVTPHHRSQPEPSNQVSPHHRTQPEPSNQVSPHHRTQPEPSNQVTSHHRSQPKQDAPQPNPSQMEAPNPLAASSQISHPRHPRAATFLGTEINPFYRGSFLRTHTSQDSYPYHMGPIQQRTQDFHSPRKIKSRASQLMPPKWTGLGQLQSWVFGDSLIGKPVAGRHSNNGTWSWRQIFGKSKKRTQSQSQV